VCARRLRQQSDGFVNVPGLEDVEPGQRQRRLAEGAVNGLRAPVHKPHGHGRPRLGDQIASRPEKVVLHPERFPGARRAFHSLSPPYARHENFILFLQAYALDPDFAVDSFL
jgi:hypothetical protein